MASLRELVDFGWNLLLGQDGYNLSPPATFEIPAGEAVSIDDNERAEQWQKQAWRLWKLVGEIHYPSTRLSRQTSQLDWRVRVNGRELSPQSAKNELQAVTRGIGPQEATYLLSLNDMVAGEAWYVEAEPGRHAVWSVAEKDLNKKIEAIRGAGRSARRMHQPDPTNPEKADSSVRTAIGPAEELLTLQSLSESQARSRLSQAGVIVTPAEQLYSDKDPWEENLVESMTAAIRDVKSPAALAPIHIRMRRDLIEMVRYITFPRPYDDLIDRKQERAISRVASALDIEPELLQGLGDSTYWNAWAISMDTYQAHIAPRAERIGNLYASVAEQIRRDAGQRDVVVEITPDPRVMLARRSSVRDAMDAWKLGVVGPRYVRDAIGATEQDAPNEEDLELLERIQGRSQDMDRERRVGENPGPARSSPENASNGSSPIRSDFEIAEHARKELGLKLREAWRNTPHRNRLSGLLPSDYTCHIPIDDIAREMPITEVIGDAVRELALADEAERLTSWILDTLLTPTSGLRALEDIDA